jgi:hypothetical protein
MNFIESLKQDTKVSFVAAVAKGSSRNADPLLRARENLVEGCKRQIQHLRNDTNASRIPWFVKLTNDGGTFSYLVGLRDGLKIIELIPGQTRFAYSGTVAKDRAIKFYHDAITATLDGQMDMFLEQRARKGAAE